MAAWDVWFCEICLQTSPFVAPPKSGDGTVEIFLSLEVLLSRGCACKTGSSHDDSSNASDCSKRSLVFCAVLVDITHGCIGICVHIYI